MTSPRRTLTLLAVVLGATLVGAGGGAALYGAFAQSPTKTVVRQVTVAGAQPAAATSSLSVGEIYRRAYKGVVEITVTSSSPDQFGFGGSQAQQAQGSGWVYDTKGDIITNQHVVDGATSIKVKFWNGATYTAHVVGTDASTDVAVIKVDAPSSILHPLSVGSSSKVAVGDPVVAIGSPFGLAETVTSGIVSALHRQMTSPNSFTIDDSIQTDAAINHGNSGGPLLNAQGQVIGMNAQIESDSGGNDGVGFAIPSDTVKSVVGQILATGTAKHAYLGVQIQDSTSPAGARVAVVKSGTAAAKAGLKVGDVITAEDGAKVANANALQVRINAKQPGDKITLTYVRKGKSHTAHVTLGTRPS
jgi:putative serine protease PepD